MPCPAETGVSLKPRTKQVLAAGKEVEEQRGKKKKKKSAGSIINRSIELSWDVPAVSIKHYQSS